MHMQTLQYGTAFLRYKTIPAQSERDILGHITYFKYAAEFSEQKKKKSTWNGNG